jgi:repressor LexA
VHDIQLQILKYLKTREGILDTFSYRSLGQVLNVNHVQQIKHHVLQLEKRGLVIVDLVSKVLKLNEPGSSRGSLMVTIPIIGAANCGQATLLAQENYEGTLKISKKLISNKKDKIFAIRAVGNSMNRADVEGVAIEQGDYVVVDGSPFNPVSNNYVLAIIDDFGVIKKYLKGKNGIELISESTEEHPSIHIHPDDQQFIINGKVIYVIRKSKTNSSNQYIRGSRHGIRKTSKNKGRHVS